MLRHNGQVLLERRPSPGIWGGLWSLPEASGDDIARDCRDLGYSVTSMRNLAEIEHGFTHFRLTIQPVLCDLRKMPLHAESPDVSGSTSRKPAAPRRRRR